MPTRSSAPPDLRARALAGPVTCPCGGVRYALCCGRFLEEGVVPPTALDLMRSRYSAYVLERFDYLKATWHPKTCPPELGKDQGGAPRWLGLDVKKTTLLSESRATVEFVARYRIGARGYRLHERSLFERIDGRWTYREGEMLA